MLIVGYVSTTLSCSSSRQLEITTYKHSASTPRGGTGEGQTQVRGASYRVLTLMQQPQTARDHHIQTLCLNAWGWCRKERG